MGAPNLWEATGLQPTQHSPKFGPCLLTLAQLFNELIGAKSNANNVSVNRKFGGR